jgi:hypothetical protein
MDFNELTNWIPAFVILTLIIIGAIYWKRSSTQYKIEALKQNVKAKKKEETFEGAITGLLDSAPKNLEQIESEIATLKAKGATPEMLARLESERDMLKLAVKYGHLAKPLGGTIGKLLEKLVGGIGN